MIHPAFVTAEITIRTPIIRYAISACFLLASCTSPDERPGDVIDDYKSQFPPGFRAELGWLVRDGRDPALDERSYKVIRESQTTISPSEREHRIGLGVGCEAGKGWSATLSVPANHNVAGDSTLNPAVQATLTVYSHPPEEFHRWEDVMTVLSTQTLTADNSKVLVRKMATADSMQFSFTPSGKARRAVKFELDGLATLLASGDSACGPSP